jgi:hypothetical protein
MDKLSVMKIPEDILDIIITKRNPRFRTKIDKNDLFNIDNISTETMNFLCWITYSFWMNDIEKRQINKINLDIYIESEQEKLKKYNPNNLFKKRKNANIET